MLINTSYDRIIHDIGALAVRGDQVRSETRGLFARRFLKSIVFVLIFFAVGVISYQIVMALWNVPEAQGLSPVRRDETKKEAITVASIDDISKNLIFVVNSDTGEFKHLLLEIFHCKDKRMEYITIPIRTQITISESLYQKLTLVHPAIPQVMKLSAMTGYFDEDVIYDYSVLIMKDILGIEISYYTAISEELYNTMFTSIDNSHSVFSNDYKEFLRSIKTAEELKDYIEETYPNVISNLSLFEKMNYFESYLRTPLNRVTFNLINGNDKNSAYYIDRTLAKKQIEDYIKGK